MMMMLMMSRGEGAPKARIDARLFTGVPGVEYVRQHVIHTQ